MLFMPDSIRSVTARMSPSSRLLRIDQLLEVHAAACLLAAQPADPAGVRGDENGHAGTRHREPEPAGRPERRGHDDAQDLAVVAPHPEVIRGGHRERVVARRNPVKDRDPAIACVHPFVAQPREAVAEPDLFRVDECRRGVANLEGPGTRRNTDVARPCLRFAGEPDLLDERPGRPAVSADH
jgi:hypothetical protein